MAETTYYAIGDVHGMGEMLARLHDAIIADIAARGEPAAVVHLGDYVDRGPHSREVMDLPERLPGVPVHALRGNHEQMMLDAYVRLDNDSEEMWLFNGGVETLESYGVERPERYLWRTKIDEQHVEWLRSLPALFRDEARGLVFVHAGIEPNAFPNCEDEIYLWTRSRRFFETRSGRIVLNSRTSASSTATRQRKTTSPLPIRAALTWTLEPYMAVR
jgi:serine/threonine protein phosphatase 1